MSPIGPGARLSPDTSPVRRPPLAHSRVKSSARRTTSAAVDYEYDDQLSANLVGAQVPERLSPPRGAGAGGPVAARGQFFPEVIQMDRPIIPDAPAMKRAREERERPGSPIALERPKKGALLFSPRIRPRPSNRAQDAAAARAAIANTEKRARKKKSELEKTVRQVMKGQMDQDTALEMWEGAGYNRAELLRAIQVAEQEKRAAKKEWDLQRAVKQILTRQLTLGTATQMWEAMGHDGAELREALEEAAFDGGFMPPGAKRGANRRPAPDRQVQEILQMVENGEVDRNTALAGAATAGVNVAAVRRGLKMGPNRPAPARDMRRQAAEAIAGPVHRPPLDLNVGVVPPRQPVQGLRARPAGRIVKRGDGVKQLQEEYATYLARHGRAREDAISARTVPLAPLVRMVKMIFSLFTDDGIRVSQPAIERIRYLIRVYTMRMLEDARLIATNDVERKSLRGSHIAAAVNIRAPVGHPARLTGRDRYSEPMSELDIARRINARTRKLDADTLSAIFADYDEDVADLIRETNERYRRAAVKRAAKKAAARVPQPQEANQRENEHPLHGLYLDSRLADEHIRRMAVFAGNSLISKHGSLKVREGETDAERKTKRPWLVLDNRGVYTMTRRYAFAYLVEICRAALAEAVKEDRKTISGKDVTAGLQHMIKANADSDAGYGIVSAYTLYPRGRNAPRNQAGDAQDAGAGAGAGAAQRVFSLHMPGMEDGLRALQQGGLY